MRKNNKASVHIHARAACEDGAAAAAAEGANPDWGGVLGLKALVASFPRRWVPASTAQTLAQAAVPQLRWGRCCRHGLCTLRGHPNTARRQVSPFVPPPSPPPFFPSSLATSRHERRRGFMDTYGDEICLIGMQRCTGEPDNRLIKEWMEGNGWMKHDRWMGTRRQHGTRLGERLGGDGWGLRGGKGGATTARSRTRV